jgi:hypothetical protein
MTDIEEALNDLEQATQFVASANAKISKLIDQVKVISEDSDRTNVQRGKLESACRYYFYLTEKYGTLDDARKKIGAQLEYMSRDTIPEIMTERGVRNITLDDVERQFLKSVRMSASMLNKEEAMDWLKSVGAADLIQPTVNSSSFSSFVKQYIEEQQVEPPDCVKLSAMTVTQVRKSTSKG